MSQEIVHYFAYGANRSLEMMGAITGNKNLVVSPTVLKGYELCIQKLNQIPDAPRKLLQDIWPENFSSYVIRPSSNKDNQVAGVLWELTPLERELVRDWELIEMGWYKDEKVKVTKDGKEIEVETEVLGDGQRVDRVVDGTDYPTFLNELGNFQKIANNAREEYFERQKNKEGRLNSPERKL